MLTFSRRQISWSASHNSGSRRMLVRPVLAMTFRLMRVLAAMVRFRLCNVGSGCGISLNKPLRRLTLGWGAIRFAAMIWGTWRW